MKIQVPGHRYDVKNLEQVNGNDVGQTIQFIYKEPISEGSTEYKTLTNGTTTEEVLEVLIDRLSYLQIVHQGGKFKCKENACAITHLEEALHWLESRTKKRISRGVKGKHVP